MKYVIPKGTFDILPEEPRREDKWRESNRWTYLEETIRALAHEYGYREIRTPLFEQTALFTRGVGETSDIVSKEMYTFLDKGKRSMSLRPEGTASVIRAFVQGGLWQLGSLHKFFYIGPFFRYDRPQAGRYRQFHQFGVEAIGDATPEQDFEVIELLLELYRRLGLQNTKVMVNTLGMAPCRVEYKKRLLTFLKPHFNTLSPESQIRFAKNPLRILDSKDLKEQALLEKAPTLLDCLDRESREHFETLCSLLNEQHIAFDVVPKLVRGLDYYNQTVFEITSDVLGAQNTIGAGGRYDGLLATLGGPDLPSIGFSTGLERILQTMEGQKSPFPLPPSPFLYFISMGERAKKIFFPLLYTLRHQRVPTQMTQAKKIQKGLQMAEQLKVAFAVIIGEREVEKGVAQVKTMETRETREIPLDQLVNSLMQEWRTHGL